MKNFTYEIEKVVGKISEGGKGWSKELRIVSWNGNKAKYDIRQWNDESGRCLKGITLTYDELLTLRELIEKEIDDNNCI